MGAWKRELKRRAKAAEEQKIIKDFHKQDLPVGPKFIEEFNKAMEQAMKENK